MVAIDVVAVCHSKSCDKPCDLSLANADDRKWSYDYICSHGHLQCDLSCEYNFIRACCYEALRPLVSLINVHRLTGVATFCDLKKQEHRRMYRRSHDLSYKIAYSRKQYNTHVRVKSVKTWIVCMHNNLVRSIARRESHLVVRLAMRYVAGSRGDRTRA